jgi:PLP dependent protein
MNPDGIATNLARVQERIARAAERAGRRPQEITLIGVSKTQPVEHVISAYRANLRDFGENRVEEAAQKIPAFRAQMPAAGVTWHMVGHVQGRKAGPVLEHFDTVDSVDSLKLARRLNRLAEAQDRGPIPILLECNVSGEISKFGFDLRHWQSDPAQFEEFKAIVAEIANLNRVRICGLMTMAPLGPDPDVTRPVFRSLANLRDRLKADCPNLDWSQLSMGMTDDFEIAIEEGATHIRVGRAIFGARAAGRY